MGPGWTGLIGNLTEGGVGGRELCTELWRVSAVAVGQLEPGLTVASSAARSTAFAGACRCPLAGRCGQHAQMHHQAGPWQGSLLRGEPMMPEPLPSASLPMFKNHAGSSAVACTHTPASMLSVAHQP